MFEGFVADKACFVGFAGEFCSILGWGSVVGNGAVVRPWVRVAVFWCGARGCVWCGEVEGLVWFTVFRVGGSGFGSATRQSMKCISVERWFG